MRIIATGGEGASQGPGGGDRADLGRPGPQERARAFGHGGSAGQDVVNEHHHRGRFPDGAERACQGEAALHASPASLRRGLDRASQQPANRQAGPGAQGPCQNLGLVEPARPLPLRPQRNPREDGTLERSRARPIPGRQRAGHERGKSLRQRPGPAELEPHQGPTHRALVEERGTAPAHLTRRAVRAPPDAPRERPPAPPAARRGHQGHTRPAARAERPPRTPAAQAPGGEQDAQKPAQHERTVQRGTDRGAGQGRGSSMGFDSAPAGVRTKTEIDAARRDTG